MDYAITASLLHHLCKALYGTMNHPVLLTNLEIDEYQIIRGDDAIKIAHKWLSIYCPERTSFKGIRRYKTYMWDVMNSEFQLEDAVEEYGKEAAPHYVILEDCFGQDEKEIYITKQKPTGNNKLQDFHVFPKNMAWSMSFTHEDGWIGPKFSRHKNYKNLVKKHVQAMEAINRGYV